MKALFLLISLVFAGETREFSVTKIYDTKVDTTITRQDAEITLPKGWAIAMEVPSKMVFQILSTPKKDFEQSDVHVSMLLRVDPPKMTLEERQKKFAALKGYKVAFEMINGQNWLTAEREVPNAHGVLSIEVMRFLVKGSKEYLILSGYPKDQPNVKDPILQVVRSIKIK